MSDDIGARLARLERGILAAIKQTVQSIPLELSAYVGEYLRDPSDQAGLKVSQRTGNRYYSVPNTTNRLRTLYGNIQRSITVGGKGNLTAVYQKGGIIGMQFGYDPLTPVRSGTRNQTLEYARINEKTRPFIEPGFRKYMTDANGFKAAMRELESAIVDEFYQEFG